MKEIIPVEVKFKSHPEDFIVEEVQEGWEPHISKEDIFNTTPDLSSLEPNDNRSFLACELEKRDIDLFTAIKIVASHLHKGSDAMGYAGIKDKKAHTIQRITIFEPDLELVKTFKHPNIYLKNFRWEKRKIKLGYLTGNRFTITLRDLDKKDAMKLSSHLRKLDYFSNYFGKQRFGSVRGNNAKIGKLLIKKKFKEVLDVILEEVSDKEQEEVSLARIRLKKEKDYREALNYFPLYLRAERRILEYLSNGMEPLEVIKRQERKSMLFYVHALQSLLFNQILAQALDENFDFTRKGQQKIPLMGYRTRIEEEPLQEIEEAVLKREGIELADFNLVEIPYLRIKGDLRDAVVPIENLELEVEDDDEYEGSRKIILSFTLKKGTYATTFLENFFILKEYRE
ncbi:tRNA pseudouridine(13) synthase TruD [archaeon]|nr:tRNA pseudouridine(13) synthase TruD [archaeon]